MKKAIWMILGLILAAGVSAYIVHEIQTFEPIEDAWGNTITLESHRYLDALGQGERYWWEARTNVSGVSTDMVVQITGNKVYVQNGDCISGSII